jgi:hypothetical protein
MVMHARAGHVIAAFWSWASLTKTMWGLLDEGENQVPEQYVHTLMQLVKASLYGVHPIQALIALRDRLRRPTT